jgi:hypothetical protein
MVVEELVARDAKVQEGPPAANAGKFTVSDPLDTLSP